MEPNLYSSGPSCPSCPMVPFGASSAPSCPNCQNGRFEGHGSNICIEIGTPSEVQTCRGFSVRPREQASPCREPSARPRQKALPCRRLPPFLGNPKIRTQFINRVGCFQRKSSGSQSWLGTPRGRIFGFEPKLGTNLRKESE